MADLIIPPDPILRARAYLAAQGVGNVQGGVPAGWAWDEPLVVLRDAGGSGEYSRVLFESRLSVEASAPTRPEASSLARRVLALLRAWEDREGGVYWRGQLGNPAYFPDDETGTPLYTFAIQVAIRGEPDP